MSGCGCSGCSSGGACQGFTPAGRGAAKARRLSRLWDRARDMKARAGLRPFSVCIVRVRSNGARRRGDGVSEVVAEWPILPTPKLGDLTGLQEIVSADQLREVGTVLLSEISLAYTEDMLLGRAADGSPIPSDEVLFYEVRFEGVGGIGGQRRRFVPASAPSPNPERSEWTMTLARAPVDRDRRGGPR